MRDHRRLEAFVQADRLVKEVYEATSSFPAAERFGLSSQLRRSAFSVAANIVEGSARRSEADFIRFLDIAFGSLRETIYSIDLAYRLCLLSQKQFIQLKGRHDSVARKLGALIKSFEKQR